MLKDCHETVRSRLLKLRKKEKGNLIVFQTISDFNIVKRRVEYEDDFDMVRHYLHRNVSDLLKRTCGMKSPVLSLTLCIIYQQLIVCST